MLFVADRPKSGDIDLKLALLDNGEPVAGMLGDVFAKLPLELLDGQGRFPFVAVTRLVHKPSGVGLLPAIGLKVAEVGNRERRTIIQFVGVRTMGRCPCSAASTAISVLSRWIVSRLIMVTPFPMTRSL